MQERPEGQNEHVAADDPTVLDPVEVRVLAVLAEKEAFNPETYPLSLNALTSGCNQLSSREPVMSLSELEVQDALQRLMKKKLVAEVSQQGARVPKYEHRARIKWALEQDKLALLTVLMLRGPQTAGEIRGRVGRMHQFASVAEVENGLQFLIDKYPPLVARLSRSPGTKEARYMHLLSGDEARQQDDSGSSIANISSRDRITSLEQEVSQLRSELEALRLQFEEFRRQFQ